MKKTITKSELLGFAIPRRLQEAKTHLSYLCNSEYEISDYSFCAEFNGESAIYLKLKEPLLCRRIELILPSRFFDLGALNKELTKDTTVRIDANENLIRPVPGISDNFTLQIDKSMLSWWNDMFPKQLITTIQYNEKKRITTVVFTDGDVQMSKCSSDDEYDKYIGVALCIAAHEFKSKTKFKKFVDNHIKTKGSEK